MGETSVYGTQKEVHHARQLQLSQATAVSPTLTHNENKTKKEINGFYHDPVEVRRLFSEPIGASVDDAFSLFPPFYTDCGKKIKVGSNVFINAA